MVRVPKPQRGLVFRYGYIWLKDWQKGRRTPGKDRPACIVLQLDERRARMLGVEGGEPPEGGDVVILPITRSPPGADDVAVELSVDDKRACGLDPTTPSWVVVSEFNADMWPSPDMAAVPGGDRFEYGHAPPGLLRRILTAFQDAYVQKPGRGVGRR